jgi:hypothetical protein
MKKRPHHSITSSARAMSNGGNEALNREAAPLSG